MPVGTQGESALNYDHLIRLSATEDHSHLQKTL